MRFRRNRITRRCKSRSRRRCRRKALLLVCVWFFSNEPIGFCLVILRPSTLAAVGSENRSPLFLFESFSLKALVAPETVVISPKLRRHVGPEFLRLGCGNTPDAAEFFGLGRDASVVPLIGEESDVGASR